MRRLGALSRLAAVAALVLVTSGGLCAASELPPPDDTRLHFRKTLYVHETSEVKIFAETRKIRSGDVLWRILRDEFGVDERVIPTLIEAYREVNPGADPNWIYPGQVLRVPFKVEQELSAAKEQRAAREDVYRVQTGDSLWKILRDHYGVEDQHMLNALRQVAHANPGLLDLNKINVGQLLVIPLAPLEAPQPQIEVQPLQQPEDQPEDQLTEQRAEQPEEQSVVVVQPAKQSAGQHAEHPAEEVTKAKAQGAPQPKRVELELESEEGAPGLPEQFLSVLDVMERLDCTVEREGETFIPIARGRTLRLDAADFPIVAGPGGDKVILDPHDRLAPALVKTVEKNWRFEVVQGSQQEPEAYLAQILPHMGFHDLSEGMRTIRLGEGMVITAQARWTVVPTAEQMWEGGMYLIFPRGVTVDPHMAALLRAKGFSILLLSTAQPSTPSVELDPATRAPESLSDEDGVSGAGELLKRLGVTHSICPEVACDLGTGVSYTLEPLLTFEHEGLRYAVPPASPDKAESMLLKAGYFTLTWEETATPLNRLGDLLALLAVKHERETLTLPEGAVRLEVEGLVVEEAKLADTLYANWTPAAGRPGRVLITEAKLPPEAVAVLLHSGYLPWVAQ